jgi:type IV secretory pathway VirB4 component
MMPRRIRQIQQVTWNQMSKGQRTIEIVDEAWWLLQNADTADDLSQRARRFRKKNAALFLATQHPEDFVANRHAHAVLNMVATHLLFAQNTTSIDQIASIFKLNPQEKQALSMLQRGQYFLKTSRLRALMYKHVPESRDGLYTTVPEEVARIKAQLAAEEEAEQKRFKELDQQQHQWIAPSESRVEASPVTAERQPTDPVNAG